MSDEQDVDEEPPHDVEWAMRQQESFQYDNDLPLYDAWAVLAAEVERLRVELQKVQNAASTARAQQALAEADCDRWRNEAAKLAVDTADAHRVKELEAENAELRKLTDDVDTGVQVYRLVSDNTEARVNVAELLTEFNRIKARLAWFEAALPHLLSAIEDYDDIEAVDAAKEWLEQHPKPE